MKVTPNRRFDPDPQQRRFAPPFRAGQSQRWAVIERFLELAAQRATQTIPIVMALVGDPEGVGLVETLAGPGGNITGLTNMSAELAAKRLQLLKQAVSIRKTGWGAVESGSADTQHWSDLPEVRRPSTAHRASVDSRLRRLSPPAELGRSAS